MTYTVKQTPTEIRIGCIEDEIKGKCLTHVKVFRIIGGKLKTEETHETLPYKGLADKLSQHGFRFITALEYNEFLIKAKDILLSQLQKPTDKNYSIVSWETIRTKFSPQFLNDVEEYLQDEVYREFCFYNTDTIIEGDLVIDYSESGAMSQTESRNIAVNGNLIIQGCFDGSSGIDTLPQFIYVKGDLKADNMIMSGWLDIVIEGNAIVDNTILGYDGEAGGRLSVNGNVYAKHLLNGSMYPFDIKGTVAGSWYNFGDIFFNNSYKQHPVTEISSRISGKEQLQHHPLVKDVMTYKEYSKEYQFDFEQTYTRLRKGLPVFKNDLKE